MKKILGIGNALVDALYQITDETLLDEMRLPKGSMQLIDTERYTDIRQRMKNQPVKLATGGSACNTILALANLGMDTGLIGKILREQLPPTRHPDLPATRRPAYGSGLHIHHS